MTVDFFLDAMDTYVQFMVSHRYVIKALLERSMRAQLGLEQSRE